MKQFSFGCAMLTQDNCRNKRIAKRNSFALQAVVI